MVTCLFDNNNNNRFVYTHGFRIPSVAIKTSSDLNFKRILSKLFHFVNICKLSLYFIVYIVQLNSGVFCDYDEY